ncbi:beta-galactosidase [Pseudomassariella vexata]|uniref:Beta-galactosidase n=1 Tax=Pseudomassariella vexata TaxID=1141098 RepID=A0A1Y2DCJ1_9PEZI|nr:beta-galactosidase [Pseudomassariella vexata]ORY56836.1 beta-galactosidase [Pseudomassariella vexata]
MPRDPEKRELLQKIVTWDDHSLFINGERIMLFSGEVHPFRLPVPSLYLDVFQKIKAMGFNCVSFYVMWALLEGNPGNFTAEGVFDLVPFFEAASEAGLYLIARPGPYINAEVTGGGYPGWLQRVKGLLRTNAPDYLAATDNYMENIGKIIAKYQITEGGPVILWQPENEYSRAFGLDSFPQKDYMQYVEDQARNVGIVVPLITNDMGPLGLFAPGTGEGEVDIYGHDSYPLGFDCSNPTVWPANYLPTDYRAYHLKQSPTTPYSLLEYQGGSFDPWGGPGFEHCSELLSDVFERVFYKNIYAAGVTILNLTYGGTNWGGISFSEAYTSYDYGAAIQEDGRTITREKYGELKLQAQMLKVSRDYLTATPNVNFTRGIYTNNTDLAITPLIGNESDTNFYVVRQYDYSSEASTDYTLGVSTSAGDLTIPQLGGFLTLQGRDSKIHITDYSVGDNKILYSTAEVFTWKQFSDMTVLLVYGDTGETHELAVSTESEPSVIEGEDVQQKLVADAWIIQFTTDSTRKVVKFGELVVYILDRDSAYDYWVPDLGSPYGTSNLNPDSVIVKAGYLVRSASISAGALYLVADFNASTAIEVIGAPSNVSTLYINGDKTNYATNSLGSWLTNLTLPEISYDVPDLPSLVWHSLDSLPEITSSYDDSAWPAADHPNTTNPAGQPLLTPVSLYGSDYGFHIGALLYRGLFTASSTNSSLFLSTRGGWAFASAVYLNGSFVGSFVGGPREEWSNATYILPTLSSGDSYVLTVIVDNMGFEEDTPGVDDMKSPRGIIDYSLSSSNGTDTPITWKITGNLGGEEYADHARGPLNEGGFFAERQGYTAPDPLSDLFDLDLPSDEWDIPLSFVFQNDTSAAGGNGAYRVLLFVNGWQFGRYVANIGPQTRFPVPEGILDYKGTNWLGVLVWALEEGGAKVEGLGLEAGTPVLTGRKKVVVVDSPAWSERNVAY